MAIPRKVHEAQQAQQSKPPARLAVVSESPAPKRKRTPDEKDRRARLRMLRSDSQGSRRYLIATQFKRGRAFLRDRDVFSDASYDWLCMSADFIVELLDDVHAARQLLGRKTNERVEGMIAARGFSDARTGRALARIGRAFEAREAELRRMPGWSWTTGWSDERNCESRILHFGRPANLCLAAVAMDAALQEVSKP